MKYEIQFYHPVNGWQHYWTCQTRESAIKKGKNDLGIYRTPWRVRCHRVKVAE